MRTAILLPDELAEWYTFQAKANCMPRNSMFILALKAWKEQQTVLSKSTDVKEMLKAMTEFAQKANTNLPDSLATISVKSLEEKSSST